MRGNSGVHVALREVKKLHLKSVGTSVILSLLNKCQALNKDSDSLRHASGRLLQKAQCKIEAQQILLSFGSKKMDVMGFSRFSHVLQRKN